MVEIVGIVLLMDLLMYIFHYLVHHPVIYKILHRKHHEHVSTNFLSLFVLHPLETLGFGLMMIFVFMWYDFSIFSITIYLFINLIWGTIGHLNREFFPKWSEKVFLGTTKFHNQHHLNEQKNFGFYTSIWDRLFKTYKVWSTIHRCLKRIDHKNKDAIHKLDASTFNLVLITFKLYVISWAIDAYQFKIGKHQFENAKAF